MMATTKYNSLGWATFLLLAFSALLPASGLTLCMDFEHLKVGSPSPLESPSDCPCDSQDGDHAPCHDLRLGASAPTLRTSDEPIEFCKTIISNDSTDLTAWEVKGTCDRHPRQLGPLHPQTRPRSVVLRI